MQRIESRQNARVKDVIRLRQRSHRNRTGLMLIEGYREIRRALDNNYPIQELYVCPEHYQGSNEPALVEDASKADATIYETTVSVFEKMSYRDRPEGLLAVAPHFNRTLNDLKLPEAPLLVIAEAVEKPGNLGTILRSADAAGADAVIVCDRCTDLSNPNVIRASIGTIFAVPVIETGSEDALHWLKKNRIQTLAATPAATRMHTEVDMTTPLAIVMGTEQYGLSELWMEQADQQVRLPMYGQVDSLNVASATTILLYEAVRQRHLSGSG